MSVHDLDRSGERIGVARTLDFYLDDAVEDACCNYDPMDYVDWDMMPGGHDYEMDRRMFEEKSDNDHLDDNFDMFMRSV